MSKTVLATFGTRDAAERAVQELRNKGFEKEISIVAKDDKGGPRNNQYNAPITGGDPVMDGTTTGGVLGGLAGLALGAGALAIPGIGPLVAAGPIAGLLSGAATGGIAGGLVDWGIPKERGQFYEDKIKQGNILVTVRADDAKANNAMQTLRQYGASDVEMH